MRRAVATAIVVMRTMVVLHCSIWRPHFVDVSEQKAARMRGSSFTLRVVLFRAACLLLPRSSIPRSRRGNREAEDPAEALVGCSSALTLLRLGSIERA